MKKSDDWGCAMAMVIILIVAMHFVVDWATAFFLHVFAPLMAV